MAMPRCLATCALGLALAAGAGAQDMLEGWTPSAAVEALGGLAEPEEPERAPLRMCQPHPKELLTSQAVEHIAMYHMPKTVGTTLREVLSANCFAVMGHAELMQTNYGGALGGAYGDFDKEAPARVVYG